MIGLLRQVQGWVKLKGDSDGTKIGNIGDRIKVTQEEGDEFILQASATIGGLASSDIIDYEVPAGKTLKILSVSYSGENRSKMDILRDAQKLDDRNLYYGEFNGDVPMHNTKINAAEHLIVKFSSIVNKSGDYSATIYGRLI